MLDTVSGYWVYPLFLSVVDGGAHGYAIRLVFASDGRLSRVDAADAATELNAPAITYTSPEGATQAAVDCLNLTGPRVLDQLGWTDEALRRKAANLAP